VNIPPIVTVFILLFSMLYTTCFWLLWLSSNSKILSGTNNWNSNYQW